MKLLTEGIRFLPAGGRVLTARNDYMALIECLFPPIEYLKILYNFVLAGSGTTLFFVKSLLILTCDVMCFSCSEACLISSKSASHDNVKECIASYLKHAPEKPGCPRYKVCFMMDCLHSVGVQNCPCLFLIWQRRCILPAI